MEGKTVWERERITQKVEEETTDKGELYTDLICLVIKVSGHILEKNNSLKKETEVVMGDDVLKS